MEPQAQRADAKGKEWSRSAIDVGLTSGQEGSKFVYARRNFLGCANQCVNQGFVDVEMPFIFCDVAFAVCIVENSPLFWREFDGVFQALKHGESML